MSLLFYPLKSHRHPALRDSGLVGQRRFNDVSAILVGKDTKNFGKKYSLSEKSAKNLQITEKLLIFAARKEPI